MNYHTVKLILSVTSILFLYGCSEKAGNGGGETNQTAVGETVGFVEKANDELEQLLNPQAKPEIIAQGFEWAEGPLWVEEHQWLLFSDVFSNAVYRWKAGEGTTEYLKPSGYTGAEERDGELGSNGLILGNKGHLILCQHGDRRIARMSAPLARPAAEFTTLAGSYQDKIFNSPNDLVQHSNGDIYFTDPPYGFEEGMEDPKKELEFQGVYRLSREGNLTLLTDELSRPNGISLSPDEKTLYVSNSDPDHPVWMAYSITETGRLSEGRIFHDATEFVGKEAGLPDGLTVDAEGYLYATGPGGVWIFAPDGRVLGKIRTGRATSNCTIGNGGNMLYITADEYVLRMPLK